MKVCVFVPVYNQALELPVVLEEIDAIGLSGVDFLIVDNGSTDGSEALVRHSRHAQLFVPRNRGVGYSYMLALDWALARRVPAPVTRFAEPGEYSVFAVMASNAKMLASELPCLFAPIHAGQADYVTGSRFLDGGASPHLPAFRRRTIPLVNLWARACTGRRLTDATNGFRAFRLELITRARFDWHAEWLFTYAFEYYLYAKVLLDPRMRCIEVPSTMRYPSGGRYTHIRPGLDYWPMLKPWLVAGLDGRGFE